MHRLKTPRFISRLTWRYVLVVLIAIIAAISTTHYVHTKLAATTTTSNFSIPELGVSLTLPSGLNSTDLQYSADLSRPVSTVDEHSWSTISFTTKSLLQLDPQCSAAEGSIGMLVRYTEDPKAIHAQVVKSSQLGNYYYAFAAPQGSCTENSQAQKLEAQQIALLQQAFDSLREGN